jgi:hypothetical protein
VAALVVGQDGPVGERRDEAAIGAGVEAVVLMALGAAGTALARPKGVKQ